MVADIEGEHRLSVFENSVLREIFGAKRDEVTGEWRKLHNEELNDLVLLTKRCAGDKIFGLERDVVTGEWRKLHNEELNDVYCSANIMRVIKSRIMRWAGHVARIGEGKGMYRVLLGGNRRDKFRWGDLGVDGWIILGWICRRWDVGIWTGLGWPRIETSGGHL